MTLSPRTSTSSCPATHAAVAATGAAGGGGRRGRRGRGRGAGRPRRCRRSPRRRRWPPVPTPSSPPAGGLLGPGAGSFAVRRDVLADLDITEDWPAVGYEVAAQVAARGRRGSTSCDGRRPPRRPRRAPPPSGCAGRSRSCGGGTGWPAGARPEAWDASDTELASTLDNLDAATNYADWIVALMAPYLRGRILEVGAGHGTFTNLLARYGPGHRHRAVRAGRRRPARALRRVGPGDGAPRRRAHRGRLRHRRDGQRAGAHRRRRRRAAVVGATTSAPAARS